MDDRMTVARADPAPSEHRGRGSRAARRPDAPEDSRWIPSLRALVITMLLGAAAGVIGAFWVTLIEAKGLVLSLGS